MATMTDTELRAAEQNHDNINNGGGEGYNPHRAERQDRERAARASQPRTRDDIIHELGVLDCSIARESGTYDAERIAALRSELDALAKVAAIVDQAAADTFAREWTIEITRERRATWNGMVKAKKINSAGSAQRAEAKLGWTMRSLKKAIKLYSL